MRRRDFITGIAGPAAAWPLVARAQQPAMPVIGVLGGPSAAEWMPRVEMFQQSLRELGYIEGRNLRYEHRWADGQNDRLPALAAELVRRQVSVIYAELTAAFDALVRERADAIFIGNDAFFTSRRIQLILLAARHALAASYPGRQYPEVGGLMSYGSNIADAYRQIGIYTGRILRGAKPADLPVVQSSKFLTVPPSLLAIADEVIE